MISYLKGLVIQKTDKFIVLDVNNVGYQIYLNAQTLDKTTRNAELSFFIHTHVREDALELYGFISWDELEFFSQLIQISGVGPRTALAVLSLAPLDDIKKAVVHGDPEILQKVAGIGKKTAERIIVELKEKIAFTLPVDSKGFTNVGDTDVIDALMSLGYKEREIRQILPKLPEGVTDLSQRIREALKILGGNH